MRLILLRILILFSAMGYFASFVVPYQQEKKGDVPDPSVWEWEYRDALHQPERVMDAIGVKPGMLIGEAGAGGGYFTHKLARRVGENGKIYANDIVESYLEYIKNRCETLGLKNVITILGKEEDPLFPSGVLDMAIMVHVYHYLDEPVIFLRNITPTLKPGATLVIMEPDSTKIRTAVGHSTPLATLLNQALEAGYELVRIETFLPADYIVILRPKVSNR